MGRPAEDASAFAGLVRAIDRSQRRHVYGVGAAPDAELVGELGALRRQPGEIPVWLTPEGRLVTPELPAPRRPSLRAAAKWALEPLRWTGPELTRARLRAVARRAVGAVGHLTVRRGPAPLPAGDPTGYLDREGWVPLYSSHHPITGDQLLSTIRAEADSLGYVETTLVGHLVARPQVTKSLRLARSAITWARHFGLSGTADEEPLPSGAVDQPRPADAVRSRALRISGCVVWPAARLRRIEVLVDGVPRGRARLAVPRADWAARVPAAQLGAVCGFELVLAPWELPTGGRPFHVSAVAQSLDGARYAVPGVQVLLQPARAANGRREIAQPPPGGAGGGGRDPGEGMRVLAFGHDLGRGGAQRYLHELLRRLSERPGFACTVVAPEDGAYLPAIEALGHEVRVIPERGVDAAGYEARQLELAGLAARGDFDVVLANALDSFAGVDMAARLGIPSVWAIHESFDLDVWWTMTADSEGAGSYARGRSAFALRAADALVFATDATAGLYEPHADPSRFLTIPYGLELGEIAAYRETFDRRGARRRLGIPDSADVVLCVGSIEARKAQAVLARAFAEVAGSHPHALLVLVGDTGGPYSAALGGYIESRGLASRVRVVPMTDDPYAWHGIADVFALASDVESSPFAVLEAMAFGTPSVVSRVFGLPELVAEGRTGLLCPALDVGELAGCLDRMLGADANEREAFGRAAERRVHERHHPAAHAARVYELLESLVEDAAPAALQARATSSASVAAAAGVNGSGQAPAGSIQTASANSSPRSMLSE